ncbi:histidinol dehydrogenase [Novosphingobium sp. SG751A]|uniref:histidinol dehydrogenase n=1 Tax=Novosphingobium sp. SG751A TaxID=2587000 RepID=UPI00155429D7|nr:histidinol dehydrogenase [Novosphingobium sp. SG751A]NOW44932.1 histidinol dehydrogenase [Novosphingobium sp. SG751A]
MVLRLDSRALDFEPAITAFMAIEREARAGDSDVSSIVAEIISAIRECGDAALQSYTEQFDRYDVGARGLRVSRDEVAAASAACDPELREALLVAAERIRVYHERQLPKDDRWTDEAGISLGWRWTPIDSVGLYVPGGLASYPSSVLMNAIPARVAGVQRVAMVVPTPGGVVNPLVLVAAEIAGVDEIYRVGGAQAVAALAYGTAAIAPVDKIVGPGNAFVAEAKRQVFGKVGIDTIAGPSEILVVADKFSNPAWIAADLLSQAEHDPAAQTILVTDDTDLADRVASAIAQQLEGHLREAVARSAWENNSAIITVASLDEAARLVDRFAPEHLELSIDDPEALMARIKHAGAIFLGRHTPEAIGDYIAGPDHVLPTSRVARYGSGLSVFDFIKRSSIIGCTEQGLRAIGRYAVALATSEGLHSHALSVSIRVDAA